MLGLELIPLVSSVGCLLKPLRIQPDSWIEQAPIGPGLLYVLQHGRIKESGGEAGICSKVS